MATKSVPTPQYPVSVYLIDVVSQQVVEVQYDGSLKRLYDLLNCRCIDFTARQSNGDGLYCNDLLPDDPQQAAFRFRSTGQIIYGNGVWTGGDDEGNTIAPFAELADLTADVEFLGMVACKPAPILILS